MELLEQAVGVLGLADRDAQMVAVTPFVGAPHDDAALQERLGELAGLVRQPREHEVGLARHDVVAQAGELVAQTAPLGERPRDHRVQPGLVVEGGDAGDRGGTADVKRFVEPARAPHTAPSAST